MGNICWDVLWQIAIAPLKYLTVKFNFCITFKSVYEHDSSSNTHWLTCFSWDLLVLFQFSPIIPLYLSPQQKWLSLAGITAAENMLTSRPLPIITLWILQPLELKNTPIQQVLYNFIFSYGCFSYNSYWCFICRACKLYEHNQWRTVVTLSFYS